MKIVLLADEVVASLVLCKSELFYQTAEGKTVKTADEATKQLSEKISAVIEAVKRLGVEEKDIKTKNYSLIPQYDYRDGVSEMAGYSANQQIEIKTKNINENREIIGQILSASSAAGANQVLGVNFEISSLDDLKQQARILAIKDARKKSGDLAKAAGIKKLGKVVGWYENIIQSPDTQSDYGYGGVTSEKMMSSIRPIASPQVPSGNQEIIINVGVNYEVK
jgi:uncharacterized protein YggE